MFDSFQSLKLIFGYLICAAIISVLIFFAGVDACLPYVEREGAEWSQPFQITQLTVNDPNALANTLATKITSAKQGAGRKGSKGENLVSDKPSQSDTSVSLLIKQASNIRLKGNCYLEIATYFYERNAIFIQIAIFCGAIGGGFLFLITNKGWNNTNPWIKTLFLTFAVNAAFYTAFPKAFQHTENISQNRALYAKCANLNSELQAYLATGCDQSNAPQEPAYMALYFHKNMSAILDIPVGFDANKIPDLRSEISLSSSSNPTPRNGN